jgi:putative membrane protein
MMQSDPPSQASDAASTSGSESRDEAAPDRALTGQSGETLRAGAPLFQGRLHPLTLVFALVSRARGLLIPAIPLLLFGGGRFYDFALLLLLVISVLSAMVRYFSFSYRIEGGDLITRQGLIERTERHVKLERVQEIRIEQGVLHRLFGVVDVHVETAGGQGPEASLSVLARAEAERLRQTVFAHARSQAARSRAESAAQASQASPVIIKRLGLGDLVLAGLSSNHLVSALVLVGTLWAFVDDILPENIYERFAAEIVRVVESALEQGAQAAILIAAASILLILLVSLFFSVLGTIVLFYGFTLARSGGDLQRSYGLLTRRSSNLPERRIQVLEIEEGLLRRLFRLATLRADTAGSRSEEPGDNRGGRNVLLPIARSDEIGSLLSVFFPDLETGSGSWNRVSRKAVARGTVKGALLCAGLAAASFFYQSEIAGLWPLLLLPFVYAINVMRYDNLGYRLEERYFHTRRGWLGRSTHIVPIRNLQAVVIRRSPLDRRLGLATLIVDTAGQAYTGGGPQISNLPLEVAERLARTLAHRASATRYRW